MPKLEAAERTKTVETKTTQVVPVDESASQGLGGKPWPDYLEDLSQDDREITTVKFYRMEPKTNEGHIAKIIGDTVIVRGVATALTGVIDEAWLAEKFGGGVYSIQIRSKTGVSFYKANIRIDGEPKLPQRENPAAPAPVAPQGSADASIQRLTELLDKTIDRLSNLQQAPPPSAPSAAENATVTMLTAAAAEAVKIAGSSARPHTEDSFDAQLKKAMIERLLAPPPAAPTIADRLAEMKALRDLIAPPGAAVGGGSLMDQLQVVMKVSEMMGGRGAGGGGWKDLASVALEKLPEIMQGWAEISDRHVSVEELRLQRAQTIANAGVRGPQAPAQQLPGTSAGAPPPGTHSPATTVQPGPGGIRMSAMAPGGDPAAAPPPPSTQNGAPLDTESPQFQDYVRNKIVQMVYEGANGAEIVQFLFLNNQGQLVKMLVDHSEAQITDFLKKDSILINAVSHKDWLAVLKEAREFIFEQQEAERLEHEQPPPRRVQ